jgi:6-phosphogluconolactonase
MDSSTSAVREIKVVPDAKAVAAEAAERVAEAAQRATAERGKFSIALSGGSTPKALYALLTAEPYRSRIDWSKVHVLFGDERAVPPDHKDSNYKMADEALLSKVPIPKGQVYRMKGELGERADEAAKEYGLMLKRDFADGLDVVLLGMGGDGHTASIFPHTKAVSEKEHRVLGYFAENSSTGKSWRVTMTAPYINQAREILVLLAGADKAARLSEVLEGPEDPARLPIQLIKPTNGKIVWIMDVAAAGMNDDH